MNKVLKMIEWSRNTTNDDGIDHLCLLDANRNYMKLLHSENGKWVQDHSFPIYEEKSYRSNSKNSAARQVIAAKLSKEQNGSTFSVHHQDLREQNVCKKNLHFLRLLISRFNLIFLDYRINHFCLRNQLVKNGIRSNKPE